MQRIEGISSSTATNLTTPQSRKLDGISPLEKMFVAFGDLINVQRIEGISSSTATNLTTPQSRKLDGFRKYVFVCRILGFDRCLKDRGD